MGNKHSTHSAAAQMMMMGSSHLALEAAGRRCRPADSAGHETQASVAAALAADVPGLRPALRPVALLRQLRRCHHYRRRLHQEAMGRTTGPGRTEDGGGYLHSPGKMRSARQTAARMARSDCRLTAGVGKAGRASSILAWRKSDLRTCRQSAESCLVLATIRTCGRSNTATARLPAAKPASCQCGPRTRGSARRMLLLRGESDYGFLRRRF